MFRIIVAIASVGIVALSIAVPSLSLLDEEESLPQSKADIEERNRIFFQELLQEAGGPDDIVLYHNNGATRADPEQAEQLFVEHMGKLDASTMGQSTGTPSAPGVGGQSNTGLGASFLPGSFLIREQATTLKATCWVYDDYSKEGQRMLSPYDTAYDDVFAELSSRGLAVPGVPEKLGIVQSKISRASGVSEGYAYLVDGSTMAWWDDHNIYFGPAPGQSDPEVQHFCMDLGSDVQNYPIVHGFLYIDDGSHTGSTDATAEWAMRNQVDPVFGPKG